MKKLLFLTLLLSATPVMAQPVEREVLPAPYTLKGETDPMALGGPSAPLPQSDALPATPPPGQDSQSSAYPAPITNDGPSAYGDAPAVNDIPAYPAQPKPPSAPMTAYPNNEVSGVVPQDPSKFENKIFCTLKVSFGSKCCGPDARTGEKIKSYLDSNADKLSYTRATWGKEGEYNYCVKIADQKNKAHVYKDLKKMIPSVNGTKGPVSLTGEGFEPVGDGRKKVQFSN